MLLLLPCPPARSIDLLVAQSLPFHRSQIEGFSFEAGATAGAKAG